ncbi:hypothetical protein [Metapseudomonas otitidis]|uniref:hypothetical protein n=1 Tax=Metapseudomonas otitidis TaxID=319939 RepID=UPI002449F5EB|nr:hypothetical protein [Pseudomonas otitidis]MDG9783686.1 hypothetical protein [Pseudomonas otitidis]
MREADDLIQRLTAKLTEELGNLPEDGQDHEFRIKIKGNRGNINLGTQTFEVHQGKKPPPPGSDRERICPQCDKPTWRYTQLCMHCDYDLHAHDVTVAEHEAAELKRAEQKRLLVVFTVAFSTALGLFFVKRFLPDSIQSWIIGLIAVLGVIAFGAMKAGETSK